MTQTRTRKGKGKLSRTAICTSAHSLRPAFTVRKIPKRLVTVVTGLFPTSEATLGVPNATPIHETNVNVLAGIVAKVVEIEGPVHRDEIARRITSLWGLQRTGGRIAEAISKAIDSATCSGLLNADPEFVTHTRMEVVPVRCRSNVASANLKKPEMIPQAELRQAIHYLVSEHVGIRQDEISTVIARVLGFKATSAKLRELVEQVLARLIEENAVDVRDGKLFRPG